MFTIKKATTNDIQLINEMAQIVFPATYREILSKEQLDYMMDWMYSPVFKVAGWAKHYLSRPSKQLKKSIPDLAKCI